MAKQINSGAMDKPMSQAYGLNRVSGTRRG